MDEGFSAYREACGAHRSGLPGLWDRIAETMQSTLVAGTLSQLLQLRHPGTLETMKRPLQEPEGEPGSRLRPESELVKGRYGWPAEAFTPENSVLGELGTEPWLSLRAGQAAVDFTLEDENGEPCRLSELLQSRPVVLTLGMVTCPAYQLSRASEVSLVRRFADAVHFLHVYSLEPHPRGSAAPDVGRPWELRYSTSEQPCTLEGRRRLCRQILPDHPDCQRILIDDLTPGERVNPVWATYGPAPRPGFLIRQDGIIDTSQLWFTAAHLEAAIRQLISER